MRFCAFRVNDMDNMEEVRVTPLFTATPLSMPSHCPRKRTVYPQLLHCPSLLSSSRILTLTPPLGWSMAQQGKRRASVLSAC